MTPRDDWYERLTSPLYLPDRLTARRDGNAIEYRFDGILIARCLVSTGHPHEHMIEVIRRIRELRLLGLREARVIWDERVGDK